MRALLLAVSLFAPLAAEASVDFKCESIRVADQIGGWLHFGFTGRSGSMQVEYWNGYPPAPLVDADFAAAKGPRPELARFVSEADRVSGTVATVDLPADFNGQDKFSARLELNAPGRAPRALSLLCVRH